MDLKLEDRICLVTGSSAGIGKGIVKVLAREGATTIAVARRINLLEDLSNEVEEMGAIRTHLITEDLSSKEGPENVAKKVIEEFGQIDIDFNEETSLVNGQIEIIMNCEFDVSDFDI